jgi:hypothetical protein
MAHRINYTAARCAKCSAVTNRYFLVNGVCEWCRRKTVEDLRASLHADARTHLGRMFGGAR